jgi:ATP-dependent DNA helicase RecQ
LLSRLGIIHFFYLLSSGIFAGVEAALDVLKKYWKHDQFRPLQHEIIQSVMQGHDTLALLPTGGGKSICFQVPALLLEGVCIVITPLIALMDDQVQQLKKRGIEAVAIHAGMSKNAIDIQLDNCVYGAVKFLYVSPERIQTELFIERVKRMNVALLAVDEAHCISQWGYDFRPSYLKIISLREIIPGVPCVALTATATKLVRNDIMDKLSFNKDRSSVFQKSFARPNLSFVVRKSENKEKRLLDILTKVKGSAIVYVRSRKGTQTIAEWLISKNISATFYHAGLVFEERARRQEDWIHNRSRVMVATNAFGMGIDKADVRIVVHVDLPENLESYYQEAGRGGRDGLRAYAVILYQEADGPNAVAKVEQSQPSIEFLKKIYQALSNYYQLALGSSNGESYDFDLQGFSEHYNAQTAEVYNALKRLEEAGLIQFNESYYSPSMLHLSMEKPALYAFQIANAHYDLTIKMMLRLFGGEVYSGFTKISEAYLAKALKVSYAEIVKQLNHLNELKVISYQPTKDKPQVTFIMPRQDAEKLPVDKQRLEARRKLVLDKIKAMIDYAVNSHQCRMQVIQHYFDEDAVELCGICDVCIARRKEENDSAFQHLRDEVLVLVKTEPLSIEQLEDKIAPLDQELFIDIVREMVDKGEIEYDGAWKLRLPITK